MRFDLIIAADWSSSAKPTGPRPKKDAIWVCADLRGVQEVAYFPTRFAALAWIDGWLARGERTLLGFDFAFGWPPGLAARLTGEPRAMAVWDWLAERIEDRADNANNRFDVGAEMNRAFPGTGPFWGRPEGLDLPDLPAKKLVRSGYDLPEHRACEAGTSAKSGLQLAYAGAVGGQSLVGQAALAGLRQRHADVVVWPQETGFAAPDARVVLAEIYPSLFEPADHAIKDAGQVMATTRALRAASGDWFTAPAMVPDAARIAAEEGWILGVGADGPMALPRPPDDCFALPPGIHWTPVDEALASLSALTPVTGVIDTPVETSAGRVLAKDVKALRSNPPEANAAVDGWGFAHGSLPDGPIPVMSGRAAAGQPFDGVVPPGHVLRVLTGAALPTGVDTVVMQEDGELRGAQLHLRAVPRKGANARAAVEDVVAGSLLIQAGAVLRAGDVALAIAAGHGNLPVRERLRVAVLSTGDELIAPGARPPGIYDANRPMLLSMLTAWGMVPIDLGAVPDTEAALSRALDQGAQADAILTSGGASTGDEDHLSRLLGQQGSVTHWRIAVKPGRPLALGRWNGTPLFGLPGNPVAAFTCAAIFARPALLQMAGANWSLPRGIRVPAAFSKRKKAGRREFLRARLNDQGAAEVFSSEGSGRVSGLSWAEGLVELSDEAGDIAPGNLVRYLPFNELGLG